MVNFILPFFLVLHCHVFFFLMFHFTINLFFFFFFNSLGRIVSLLSGVVLSFSQGCMFQWNRNTASRLVRIIFHREHILNQA